MRTALIWFIKDLIFPGDTAEIAHTPVSEKGEKYEYDGEGHGDDCKRECVSGLVTLHVWSQVASKDNKQLTDHAKAFGLTTFRSRMRKSINDS